MKPLYIILLLLLLSSCATVEGYIVSGVQRYCDYPEAQREAVRAAINNALSIYGHAVEVHCKADITP